MKRYLLLFILGCSGLSPAPGQTVQLVKNIAPPGYYWGDPPSRFFVKDSLMFFAADDSAHGKELWVTDGSTGGTHLLKDIYPGVFSGDPGPFIEYNGEVYFSAVTSTEGAELWKSDGTALGTTLVKDIVPGGVSSYPGNFLVLNGRLIFSAYDSATGTELWVTDGTPGGTNLVEDITPGIDGGLQWFIDVIGGEAYMYYGDLSTGAELWKTDGTPGGSVLVKDIKPGVIPSQIIWGTVLDSLLLFQAYDETHGNELWRSDGTDTGTYLVKDISAGGTSSSPGRISILSPVDGRVVNGILYFGATEYATARELWRSDGTPDGTYIVEDINPGGSPSTPMQITPFGDGFIFRAAGQTDNPEMWISDGTGAGTTLLKEIYPGTSGSQASYPYYMTLLNGEIYFTATDSVHGRELWSTDGTTDGTKLVADIVPGTGSSEPRDLIVFRDTLYFVAYDASWGIELRKLVPPGPPPVADSVTIGVRKGWNLVSLPVVPSPPTMDSVFPTATTGAYSWSSGAFSATDPLVPGQGYFVKFNTAQQIDIFGAIMASDTLNIEAGWNLVGSITTPVPVTNVTTVPGGIVTSPFYGYDGAYIPADTIVPGKGYWLRSSSAGTIILAESLSIVPGNRIRIVETGEGPPPPPRGITDGTPGSGIPVEFGLGQNYPNPFNPITRISFRIPEKSAVRLSIFDMAGQEVGRPVDDRIMEVGVYEIIIDARGMSSGVYFYRMRAVTEAGGHSRMFDASRKLVVIK